MTITVTLDPDTTAERVLTGPREAFTFRQFAEPIDLGGAFIPGLTQYEVIFQGQTYQAYRLLSASRNSRQVSPLAQCSL